jgi:hypothetical protein
MATGWQPIKIGAGGFLTGATFANDGTYAVRTDTFGAYLWNPTATSPMGNAGGVGAWQQLVTSMAMPASFVAGYVNYSSGVYEITIAPSNSSVIYMAGYVYIHNQYPPRIGVYVSSNKGANWTQTSFTPIDDTNNNPNGTYRAWGPKMAVHPTDPNTVLFGIGTSGLFTTSNGGTSWSTVSGVPAATDSHGINGIAFHPTTPTTIFAASHGNGIYRTTTGIGGTWTNIATGGPSDVLLGYCSSNGTYWVVDSSNNVWTYVSGTWTEVLTNAGGNINGVAIDPNNANHVIAITGAGQTGLNETNNNGSTWGGWSNTSFTTTSIPWLGVFKTDPAGLAFDPTGNLNLYVNGDRGFWRTNIAGVSGSITSSTTIAWVSQSVGIEQLVGNSSICVNSGNPICAVWDSGIMVPNLSVYPSTNPPLNNAAVVACWSIDYASSNNNFIAALIDGAYAGGPQAHATSSNGGATWTTFTPPATTFGGNIAVSSPTNMIFAPQGVQPYYTTNFGASTTWTLITLPGISSWGGFTGGAFNGAQQWICADRVNANTFYIVWPGTAVFSTSNSGATWANVNSSPPITNMLSNNIQARCAPGKAGHIWLSSGGGNNAGSTPGTTPNLYYSTNSGSSWNTISAIVSSEAIGFGVPQSMGGYPSVFTIGWFLTTSSTSNTVGTGTFNFTLPTGLGLSVGVPVTFDDGLGNQIVGLVNSYNSVTGAMVVNGTTGNGSGTHSSWNVLLYGVWMSPDQGVTWNQVGGIPSLNLNEQICGDPMIYGQCYMANRGAGFMVYIPASTSTFGQAMQAWVTNRC